MAVAGGLDGAVSEALWEQREPLLDDGTTDPMHMSVSKLQEMVKDRGAWRAAERGVAKSRT